MESYERLEQQFNEIVAKQAAPVAEVISGGHGPLHGVVRWLSRPMPPGTVLCEAAPRWCDYVKAERDKVLAAAGIQGDGDKLQQGSGG